MALRFLLSLFIFFPLTPAFAQFVHPYIYGGPSLQNGGYVPVAGTAGAGLDFDRPHAIALAELHFDSAQKQDSGTGRELGTALRAFYRTRAGWYAGGGVQWSELSTAIYSKAAWRPAFGAGKDVLCENFSLRGQLLYVLSGSDHSNQLHGPEISLWIPSPSTKSHLFYRQTLGAYQFHQSAVPGDPGTADRSVASFLEFTAMLRF